MLKIEHFRFLIIQFVFIKKDLKIFVIY